MKGGVTLAHSGKQHSYLTASALLQNNMLNRYFTGAYLKSEALQSLANRLNLSYLQKRFINGLSGKYVHPAWHRELKEIFIRKLFGNAGAWNAVCQRDEKFDNYMSGRILKEDSDIFWGFQGSCLNTLKSAKESGKITVVELATAHVTQAIKILSQEKELNPEWGDAIDNLTFEPDYQKRLEEEPIEADYVFAASLFTKKTLIEAGIDQQKIKLLPLCCNTENIEFINGEKTISDRPLKILFCGQTSQRKGIKYLLEAIKQLNSHDFELHIIGNIIGGSALMKYEKYFTYHKPVAQHELFKMYKDYDVLILPTVFEGFGLVIVEAMSAGLPVVTTENSMGAEIIKHRENGSLVGLRSIEDIKEELIFYKNISDDNFNKIRFAAKKSSEFYNFDSFVIRVGDIVRSLK